MTTIDDLLQKNRAWAEGIAHAQPDFFPSLARQQTPEFLWIGCSDSRVPANQVVDLAPGEVFVHRNIANVVLASDLNCASVIQFAVDVLKVRHAIVTGHYGCGGVTAALNDQRIGLGDGWLTHVRDVYFRYETRLRAEPSDDRRLRMLCELNVLEQVINLSRMPTVRDAWARGQALEIHGWCYGLEDGVVQDLGVSLSGAENPNDTRERCLAGLPALGGR